jgi:hypothetical protein
MSDSVWCLESKSAPVLTGWKPSAFRDVAVLPNQEALTAKQALVGDLDAPLLQLEQCLIATLVDGGGHDINRFPAHPRLCQNPTDRQAGAGT